MKKNSERNMKIILTLDQFPIFLPGAFGNKTRKTPGLDALTLKSTVFDRAYSTCADGLETLFQLWEALDFSSPRFAGKKVFLSDLPVEAPDFFDAGQTVSSDIFFETFGNFGKGTERKSSDFSWMELSEVGLLWVHFQSWNLDALDAWLSESENQNQVLAILGTSGELPEGDVRLYSAEVQLPWWIRFSESIFEGTRCHALVTADDFQKILDAGNPDAAFRNEIRIHSENDRWAIVTEEWFLTGFEALPASECEDFSEEEAEELEADAPELYFKPSDWWDQNDVAPRCFDEVQELLRLRDAE